MEYESLVAVYDELDSTASTDEKTAILAELFAGADDDHLPILVTLARGNPFADWESQELGVSTSLTKEAIEKATGIPDERLEDWWRETGDLGDAAERAVAERTQQTLVSTTLDVRSVHEALREVAEYEGEGSQGRRIDAIARLLSDASPAAARYLVRTVVGAMRLGVGEGTVRDAIAAAFLEPDDDDLVERAHQVTNDFRVVATAAKEDGTEGLAALDVELFRPIKVMLAEKAESIEAGLDDVAATREDVLIEYKVDGIRTQIHVDGDEIRLYTRRLEDVTEQFPDVVAAVRESVTADACILEGEIVGYDPEHRDVLPFQELSRRVKRKYEIEAMAEEIPVVVHLFDAIYREGTSLLDAPLRDRIDALEGAFDPVEWAIERVPHERPASVAGAEAFYERALADGHEGLMAKNLAAAYQPGTRVGYVMKLKPVMDPLDLVVVRAKYSEGRRSNRLGRLYLACRDPETDEFLEVGRMSTGFTDEELAEVTERLEPHVESVDGREVQLTPEVVLEVAYEEVQTSPEYGSGFALRFPRFEAFRDDLAPGDVDTIDTVRERYESQ
jgi:DNA ligase-1